MNEYREDQLTAWFPPHIKPAYAGLYPTDWGWAYWDGRLWGVGEGEARLAKRPSKHRPAFQWKRWRGLNFNPESKKGGAAPKEGKR